MEVDTYGLDEMDRKLLLTIIESLKAGRWVGTLSAAIHEEKIDRRDHRAILDSDRFLNRTPRGRMATQLAINILESREPATTEPVDSSEGTWFVEFVL